MYLLLYFYGWEMESDFEPPHELYTCMYFDFGIKMEGVDTKHFDLILNKCLYVLFNLTFVKFLKTINNLFLETWCELLLTC